MTTTATTATAPCPHCARLGRRLDRLEGELCIIRWALKSLCEHLDQHGLAGLLAGADAEDDEDADEEPA